MELHGCASLIYYLGTGLMMLEYLGFEAEAEGLRNALEIVYAESKALIPDQGGHASTTEF